jgi:hypothetical protein
MTDPLWRKAMATLPLEEAETNFAFDGVRLFRETNTQRARAKHRRNPGATGADPLQAHATSASAPTRPGPAPAFAHAFAQPLDLHEQTRAAHGVADPLSSAADSLAQHPFERVARHSQ